MQHDRDGRLLRPAGELESAAKTHRPGPRNHQRHQQKADQCHVFHEVHLFGLFRLWVLNRSVIVDSEREAQQTNYEQRRADGWVIPKEKASAAQDEQRSRTADGELRSRRAFALCISGHHAEFGEVVDAGSQEESASDNSPDEERDVDDVLIYVHGPSMLSRIPSSC